MTAILEQLSVYISAAHLDRIFLAALFGGIIGWERERHGRAAGLRTHMIVCIGAALMMIVSESMYTKYQAMGASGEFLRVDPGRIAAQVVTGIGFLGAGVIMRMGARVQGLTTAACLWLVAGIGMAAGTGMYLLALGTAILGGVVLYYLAKLEKRIERDVHKTLVVYTRGNRAALDSMREILEGFDVTVKRYTFEDHLEKDVAVYTFSVKMRDPSRLMPASQAIRDRIEKVTKIRWD